MTTTVIKREKIQLPSNVVPNWAVERTLESGQRDISFGVKFVPHLKGHTVIRRDGAIKYARTMRGRELRK